MQLHFIFILFYLRDHLRGRLHFGDNIEDEWFTIALIFRLTSLLDVVATVRDADGEILLIEAAENLPAWAQEPELSDGRVFVYKGEVHLMVTYIYTYSPFKLSRNTFVFCPKIMELEILYLYFLKLSHVNQIFEKTITTFLLFYYLVF